MKTAISGTRHPLNGEQTAACEFPAFVHPTVAAYFTDNNESVRVNMFCKEVPVFNYNGPGLLWIKIFDDFVWIDNTFFVGDVQKDFGFKANGLPMDKICEKARKKAENAIAKAEGRQ